MNPVQNLQQTGNQLITTLTGILRAFEVYDPNNATITKLLENIQQTVEGHGEKSGESLRLQTDGENFFLNQEMLRLDRQSFERASKIMEMFGHLRVNELEFRPGLELDSLREFMIRFSQAMEDPQLVEALEDGAQWGASLRYAEGTARQGRDNVEIRAEAGARFYVTLQVLTAEYIALKEQGKRPGMMAIRRTLQRLIDLVQTQRDTVIALLHYGRYRHGLEGHIARTALLSGCMAHAMGLDRRWINTICLHVFPALAPLYSLQETWSSPGRGQLEELYLKAMETPGKSLSVGAGVVRDLIAQFETLQGHRGETQAYGPELSTSLAGQITAVAAYYDRERANLVEGKRCRPVSPKEVLFRLESQANSHRLPAGLEKNIVDVLIHMMGEIPPGCLVRMENGTYGIVRNRPEVIQLTDTFGRYNERPRVTSVKRGTPLSPPLGLDMGPALAWSDEA